MHTSRSYLREFVSANERHPESVRVFPWLRPAAGDSVCRNPRDPGASAERVFKMPAIYSENRFQPPPKINKFQDSNTKNDFWNGQKSIFHK